MKHKPLPPVWLNRLLLITLAAAVIIGLWLGDWGVTLQNGLLLCLSCIGIG
ncbi:MAG TPA: hypothetical protein PKW33_20940 [Anaerolineaceae bacterium]|nr:hypothetical protein [Anaerolineaceae bacterium]HPN54076.1 hypothetical protein [Anaerolineaceae bacterium]